MKTYLSAGIILTPDTRLLDSALEIENGIIQQILSKNEIPKEKNSNLVFPDGYTITPGLIDIHVHGSHNADCMDSDYQSLNTMSNFFIKHGVTSFYATTLTAKKEDICRSLHAINSHKDSLEGANLLGAHLEGPYLNMDFKGAQSPSHLRAAQKSEFEHWFEIGGVKLITIAPEIQGSKELIEFGIQHGAEFAIGHSGASFEQVIDAANRGVRQSSHTFNGMGRLDHRQPGTVGGVLLDDRIFAQIIADGIHVHPVLVDLLIRVKGVERTILITDSIRATGISDGNYALGDLEINVQKGIARTSSGSLAGSTLTLDQSIRNTMKFANLNFQSALRMATSVPTEAMRLSGKKGAIQPGADADLTIFDSQYQVAATIVNGKLVFEKKQTKEE